MYNKRGISKYTWVVIGLAVFLLVVFPFYGDHLRYLVFSSIYDLRYIGLFSYSIGILLWVGAIFIKPLRKGKVFLIGLALVVVGMALGAPNLLLSLLTGGGPPHKGYH